MLKNEIENDELNLITSKIIGAAIEVHRLIGPGLLERVYEECLCQELTLRQINYQRQHEIPIFYKGQKLNCHYRADILVEDKVIIELKSVDSINLIHEAQLLTYLKITHKQLGLILNFNVPVLKKGIKRLINSQA